MTAAEWTPLVLCIGAVLIGAYGCWLLFWAGKELDE